MFTFEKVKNEETRICARITYENQASHSILNQYTRRTKLLVYYNKPRMDDR